MIQKIDENQVEVARITIDDKDEDKKIVEYLLSKCVAPLGYYTNPFIQELNYEKVVRYAGFISIETFVQRLSEVIQKEMKGVWVKYIVKEKTIIVSISCTEKIYKKSTYANKEFMVHVEGKEQMIVDVKTKEIPKDDYYWYQKLS